MEDSSLDSAPDDSSNSQDDLAVDIDTLSIDGTRPSVGDSVDLKVSGSISKLVDNTAFVTPEQINDQPIPAKPQATDEEEIMAQAGQADAQASPYPG